MCEKWSKEFDEKFPGLSRVIPIEDYKAIKHFIRTLLEEERKGKVVETWEKEVKAQCADELEKYLNNLKAGEMVAFDNLIKKWRGE